MKITADEVLAYYERTEWRMRKNSHAEWLKEILADGAKKVTFVEEEALKRGISEKQLRKMTEDLNIVRKKTGFNEGWEMSLPNYNNIQEPEDAQDALLKKGAFVE